MKKLILVLVLVSVSCVFANDVVTTKEGTKISCKIMEFDGKHFKCEMPNGTTAQTAVSKVQRIDFDAGNDAGNDDSIKSLTGRFYVFVNGSASIFVNGKNEFSGSHSAFSHELSLSEGDLLVIQLDCVYAGTGHFRLSFMANDRSHVVNFEEKDFKEFALQPATDIAQETFDKAKAGGIRKVKGLPDRPFLPDDIKSKSDYVWGSAKKNCLIGARITKKMIMPIPQTKKR